MPRRRRTHIPRDPVTAQIHSLSHEGRGIASIAGKTTFIDGALVGETVNFLYTKQKSNYDEGRCTEVLSPSARRVMPKCKAYSVCGGCSLQHLDTPIQVNQKQKTLSDHFSHFGQLQPQCWLEPIQANPWGYRHKARLSVRYVLKKEKLLIGFREKYQPRYLADVEQCEVLHPKVGHCIEELRSCLMGLESMKEIAQIEVAVGDNAAALIFRNLVELSKQDQERLIDFGDAFGFRLYLQPKGPDSVRLLNPKRNDEFLIYYLPDHELSMHFHPTDFTQVNPAVNKLMINQAISLLDPQPKDKVLDLFCGLGNFSLPIAKRVNTLTGVEGSQAMVARAQFNAKLNNIHNVDFHAADLTQPLTQNLWAKPVYDSLLIDPPRSGALEIVEQIEKLGVSRIVYVSCNPATLARDAGVLVNKKGFRLQSAGIMDMFPHTAHVESMALFER